MIKSKDSYQHKEIYSASELPEPAKSKQNNAIFNGNNYFTKR